MAVKKSKAAKKKPAAKAGLMRGKAKPISVSLPTTPTEICEHLNEYSVLVHGEKKIGKTSLFAQEDGAFFLEWDPPQKSLRILQQHVSDWREFMAYVVALEKKVKAGKLKYKTIVVDGVDLMYAACFKAVCKRLCIEHPNDVNDFGKSWSAIKQEFAASVHRLLNLEGVAVRFICHSAWKQIKSRTGGEVEKLVPILSGQAEEVLVGLVDIWGAYTYDGKRRVLVIEGDEEIGAGHRVDSAFITPAGKAVKEISMGTSAQQAYKNLMSAFKNEQTYVDIAGMKKKKSTGKKKGGKKKSRK